MHPRAADHWGDGARGPKHSVLFILMGGSKGGPSDRSESDRFVAGRSAHAPIIASPAVGISSGYGLSVSALGISGRMAIRFVAGGRVITRSGARWHGSWTDFDAEPRSHCCRCSVTSCCGICSVRMQFDASGLRRAGVQDVPWRARGVTLIWIRTDGRAGPARHIDALRSG